MHETKRDLKDTRFTYNGETEAGSSISYRIQGPSVTIQYACQDMGGDPQQHLH